MKKVLLVVALVVTLAAGGFAISPATVMVGDTSITLSESRAKVFFGNTVGNFLGYGQCPITGLSYYWAPFTSLEYSPSMGVIFSEYAVKALLQMNEGKAYEIAQHNFDVLQNKHWSKKGNKLTRPLVKMY